MCKGLFFVFLIGAFKDPRGHLITVQKINNKKKHEVNGNIHKTSMNV